MRNSAVFVKLETTEGTDAVPTATDAMLVSNLTIAPLDGSEVSLDYIRGYFGNSPSIRVEDYFTITFDVDLAGSGTPGTVPKWGKALRACAFAETVSAGTSVTYNPISKDMESATLYYYVDTVLHKGLGARGNVSFEMNANARPLAKFNMIAKIGGIVDAGSPLVPNFTGFQIPAPVTTGNTSGTIAGKTLGCANDKLEINGFTLDMGNQVKHRQLVGCSSVIVSDRQPQGTTSIQMTPLAVVDWFDYIRSSTKDEFEIVHGVNAGNIVTFNMPAAQLANPKYSVMDGIAMLDCDIRVLPVTGNDEVTITFT
jgi:hypothetical protein